jgi:hypothetical protein
MPHLTCNKLKSSIRDSNNPTYLLSSPIEVWRNHDVEIALNVRSSHAACMLSEEVRLFSNVLWQATMRVDKISEQRKHPSDGFIGLGIFGGES